MYSLRARRSLDDESLRSCSDDRRHKMRIKNDPLDPRGYFNLAEPSAARANRAARRIRQRGRATARAFGVCKCHRIRSEKRVKYEWQRVRHRYILGIRRRIGNRSRPVSNETDRRRMWQSPRRIAYDSDLVFGPRSGTHPPVTRPRLSNRRAMCGAVTGTSAFHSAQSRFPLDRNLWCRDQNPDTRW